MERFFRAWRAGSLALARWLTVGCGGLCVVGGLELWAYRGPPWAVGLLVVAGIVLVLASLSRRI